jgi:hypothetical protein
MYKKLSECKHCGLNFESLSTSQRANHSRWCDNNPKKDEYIKSNSGKQFQNPEVIKKRSLSIKLAHKNGKYDYDSVSKKSYQTKLKNGSHLHTEEMKQHLREKALASNHRRLRRGIVEYRGVMLDSSWELELAKRLDELCINWIRPDPIKWLDNDDVTHNYFPDFYLPDYDLYLDPKNPHAIKVQSEKLEILLRQYNNIKIISSLEECKKFNI